MTFLFMLLPLPLPSRRVGPEPAVGFPLGEWLKWQQDPGAVLDTAPAVSTRLTLEGNQ